MFILNGRNITITAGDTGAFDVTTGKGDTYKLTPNDRALFCVMENPDDDKELIRKWYTPDENGDFTVMLLSEDTADMDAGNYFWALRYALNAQVSGSGDLLAATETLTTHNASLFLVEKAVGEFE